MVKSKGKLGKSFIKVAIFGFVLFLFFPFNEIFSATSITKFSDTFAGTTIDTVKWTEIDTAVGGSGGTAGNVQQNEVAMIKSTGAWATNGLKSVDYFDRSASDVSIETDVIIPDCSAYEGVIGYGDFAFGTNPSNAYLVYSHGPLYFAYYNNGVRANLATASFTCTNNVSFHVRLVVLQEGGAELYINSSSTPAATLAVGTFTNKQVFLSSHSSVDFVSYDNYTVNAFAPDAPTNLAASPSDSAVFLSWTAPADNGGSAITDYLVEYKVSTDSIWGVFADSVTTTASANVSSLTNSISYDFRVSAISVVGTSTASSVVSSTPIVAVPGQPLSLYGLPGNGQVSLSWAAPLLDGGSAITDYIVKYTTSSVWSTFSDGTSSSTTAVVTGLTNNTTYGFSITAVNSVGNSVTSSVVYVTPRILQLSDIFSGAVIDTAKWTEVDTAVGGSGGSAGKVQQNNGLIVLGTDAFGTNGVKSTSTYSRERNDLIIESDLNTQDCTAYSGGVGFGDLNIGANPGDAYIAYSHDGAVFAYYHNGVRLGVATSTFSCTNNTPFHFKIVVLQAGGAELYIDGTSTPNIVLSGGSFTEGQVFLESHSSSQSVTYNNFSLSASVPGAPTNLVAGAGDSQVSLTWDAPTDNGGTAITDYTIEYKQNSTASWSSFVDGVSATASTIVTGLSNGINYNFRVSAINAIGISTSTSIVTAMPITAVASAPSVSGVSITGTSTLTGVYAFVDTNGDSEGSSVMRWLKSDTASGTYLEINGANSLTYTPTAGDINSYIKFEITPVATVAPTTGTTVTSSATSRINVSNDYISLILSTGQSLSLGSLGTPALSTSQSYGNLMLDGSSLVPLIESSVESISSAMANGISADTIGDYYRTVVAKHGTAGAAYVSLKKGTAAYQNGMTQAATTKTAVEALGKTLRVIGVTVIHGESDFLAGNSDSYESYLEEWQSDYETDVKAITGQSGTIPLFTDQMSSHTGYSTATSSLPIAQLAASESNPGKIILVTPKYFFDYADHAHLVNTSYRLLGEYYGKVMQKVVVEGETWKPLSPEDVVRNGNIIYATFNVPEAPITFDTSTILEATNYGFEYFDNSSSASISSVEIYDTDTVKITLNTTPTGSGQKLRYAYTGTAGATPGGQVAGSIKGNLRDSDPTISLSGNYLYNWSVQFDEAITEDSAGPTLAEVNAITTPTSSTVPSYTFSSTEAGTIAYGGGCSSSVTSAVAGSNTISFLTLANGTYNSCTITVTDNYGNTSSPLAVSSFVVDNVAPSVPAFSTITPAISSVVFVWDSVSGASSYAVSSTAVSVSSTSNTNMTLSGFTPNSLYYFQIKSIDAAGNSSNYSTVTSTYTLASVPSSVSGVANSQTAITISYSGDATDYYVENTTKGTNSGWTTATSYQSTGLVCGTSYIFRVKGRNSVGVETSYADSITVNTTACGGGGIVIFNPPVINSATTVSITPTITGGTVAFNFNVSNAAYVAISDNVNFVNSSWETYYATNKIYKLSSLLKAGETKKIYIKFRAADGSETKVQTVTLSGAEGIVGTTNDISATVYLFNRNLAPGVTNNDVKLLQKYLNTHGFVVASRGAGSPGRETAFFGAATKTALIKFQKAKGLKQTGILDLTTRNKINSVLTAPASTVSQPQTPLSSYVFKSFLTVGSSGEEVRQLQLRLQELGYMDKSIKVVSYFGVATKAAVIKLQKDNKLIPVAGYVGPGTRKILNKR